MWKDNLVLFYAHYIGMLDCLRGYLSPAFYGIGETRNEETESVL